MTRYAIPFAFLLMTIMVMACNKADCPCEEPAVESVVTEGVAPLVEPTATKPEDAKDAKAVEPKKDSKAEKVTHPAPAPAQ